MGGEVMGLERINEIKKQKGLTNAQLADKANLTLSTLDKITSGYNTNPKLATVEAICKALGCTISDLLSESPVPEKNNKANNIQDSFSSNEKQHIKKYRELDIHGKKIVDIVLNEEYERCTTVVHDKSITRHINLKISKLPASAGTGLELAEENYETVSVKYSDVVAQADFAVRVSGDSMEPTYYDGDILLVENVPTQIGDIGVFVVDGDGYVKEYGGDRLVSHNEKYPDIMLKDYDYVMCSGRVIGVLEESDFE